MYDRKYGEKDLNFEASGALWKASLVMRDRETNSWWSIMTSKAIGGNMDGSELTELPFGEKATWADWVKRHPHTLVLSVSGIEHDPENHYETYFSNDSTFRDLEVADQRLAPKAPIFSFHHGGKAWAAPHDAFFGGKIFDLGEHGRVFLHRREGISMFASTTAYFVDDDARAEAIRGNTEGLEAVEGFDTFWYNWVEINKDSEVLQ